MTTHYFEREANICGEQLAVCLEYKITSHGNSGNGWDDAGDPYEIEVVAAWINEGSREGEDVLKYLGNTLAWDKCQIKLCCRHTPLWIGPIQRLIFGEPYRLSKDYPCRDNYYRKGFYLEKVTQLEALEAELFGSQDLIDASNSEGEFYDE